MSAPSRPRTSLAFATGCRRLFRLLSSDCGVVSIELVLIIPMLALLLVAFDETYMFIRTRYAIEHTAYALANSVGQYSTVVDSSSTTSSNTLGSIWKVATAVAAPVKLQSSGAVIITSICDATSVPCGAAPAESAPTGVGKPRIWWQRSAPWSAAGLTSQVSSSAPLPSAFPFANGDAAFVVEVYYTFDPFAMLRGFWPGAPGAQQLYERFYARPRGASIEGNAPISLTAS
ncbi:pilus assembly protein [Paraburkholderia sediminicola]|uniref:pilus assembly protein n=1 Tax=Paraburkholderia sediminicola TaxID=458836 RepID=UPI0038BB6A6C